MATIQKHCDDRNKCFEPRRKWFVDTKNFLCRSGGNLLINGGVEDKRRKILLEELALEDGVTVILTDSPTVEDALIEAVRNGTLRRRLALISEKYPNYDPLLGVSLTEGAAFFAEIAEGLGYRDRSSLTAYYMAFAALCKKPISLRRLSALAEHSAAALIQLAANQDELLCEQLVEAAAGARPFRDVLRLLQGELEDFSSDSGLSIITSVRSGQDLILCIRLGGDPHRTASLLAAELRSLTLGKPFNLVLYDCPFLHDEGFAKTIGQIKLRSGGVVCIATENIVGYPTAEALQKNTPRQIHLLDGNVSAFDLQTALDRLGSYTRFERVSSRSTPMRLMFSLENSKTSSMTPYQRSRVLVQELYDVQAVLSSPHCDLMAAVKLL